MPIAWLIFDRDFITSITSREGWEGSIQGETKDLHYYADASKIDEQVAFGLYSKELDRDIAHRLPDTYSVVKWLSRHIVTNTGVILYSDSQAVTRSLEAKSLNIKAALDCLISRNEMAKQFNIQLIWMPGYRERTLKNYKLQILDLWRSRCVLSLDCRRKSTLVSVIRGHYHTCEHARRLRIDSNDVYRNCGDEEGMKIVEFLPLFFLNIN